MRRPPRTALQETWRHNYFVSSWKGEIYYLQMSGLKEKVLDTKAANMNAVTIDFMENGCLLLGTTFYNNRIVAYEVKYE